MRIIRVGAGEVAIEADAASAAEVARQRVNEVIGQLADVVFKEEPAIGLSAMVSFLGALLSDGPEPIAQTRAIGGVLETLVSMNITREGAVSIYLL
jgi:hypothetical protein